MQLNTLGTIEERLVYREKLVDYFSEHLELLDEDSRRRLHTNPLRILDSKNEGMRELIANAPELSDFLGSDSQAHFKSLTETLKVLGIEFVLNTRLVRGLDYYSKTVFEWVTAELGAQGTICAGGRYDGLIEQLGGKANHAVGFAMGMERILALMETLPNLPIKPVVDVYMIRVGEQAERISMEWAETIRNELPGLRLQLNCGGGSFKSQFKKADKSGAEYALIVGDDEAIRGEVGIKALRQNQDQQNLLLQQALEFLKSRF